MPLPYMVFVGSFLCFSGWLFIPWSVKMMSTIRKQAPGLLGGLSCPPAARHRGCLRGRVETAGCAAPKKSPCTLFPPFFFFLCLTGEQPARGQPHWWCRWGDVGMGSPISRGLVLGCRQRGGQGEAVGSSRLASELETSQTLAGDTCIRCSETITKPA